MLRVFISSAQDPYLNLSFENWLFREKFHEDQILILWTNSPCVVMGRFQNPWVECDLQRMFADQVLLCRRQSGGGTVYHDPGNLNFSFISPRDQYDKKKNLIIVANSGKPFDLDIQINERNDLVIENDGTMNKISGSAFKENRDRCFHHGTLLVNTELDKLNAYISSKVENIESKAVPSVRSKVVNLSDLNDRVTIKKMQDAIANSFSEYYEEKVMVETFDAKRMMEDPFIKDYFLELTSWRWAWQETPKFKHQYISFSVDVKKALIQNISSDSFSDSIVGLLNEKLIGCEYRLAEIIKKLNDQIQNENVKKFVLELEKQII